MLHVKPFNLANEAFLVKHYCIKMSWGLSDTLGTWQQPDDVLASLNSICRIPGSTPSSGSSSRTSSLNCQRQNLEAANKPTFPRLNYNNGYSDPSIGTGGMGRGKLIANMLEKFSTNPAPSVFDSDIHPELERINGEGYSNVVIERRFGLDPSPFSLLPENSSSTDEACFDSFDDEPDRILIEEKKDSLPPHSVPQGIVIPVKDSVRKEKKCRNAVVLKLTESSDVLQVPQQHKVNKTRTPPRNLRSPEYSPPTDFVLKKDDFPPLI